MEVPRAWLVGLGVVCDVLEGRGIEGAFSDNLVLGMAAGTDDLVVAD